MSGQERALVIGGSVGGLFAAHMLRSIGWDVVVFERSRDDLVQRGAGIGATNALFAVMRRIGVPFDAADAIAVPSRVWLETNGNIAAEVPTSGAFATAWAHVYQALRDALPRECCCFNKNLVRVDMRAHDVMAIFADGSSASGSLLIAADGIHSTVRRQLLPEVVPRYAGYVCWRGVVEEADTPISVQSRLFDRVTFCFPAGELFLGIPNPGTNHNILPGRRRYYFAWYRPADYQSALQDLCTDATGRQHGVAIPPPLVRHEIIRELKATAGRVLAPEMAAVVARAEQPLLQAVFDLESPQLVFGRVVILGDAAFVARPHVVAGVTKAALDAQCLADSLAAAGNDVETALAHYDTERRQFGRSLVARARHLGAYLEASQTPNEEELTREPDSFMRDYGADELLRNNARASPIAQAGSPGEWRQLSDTRQPQDRQGAVSING
jgi:2-polyprenyl-6-methoxyphenol hydroxylase-like FAD-dependent oxidoreductase